MVLLLAFAIVAGDEFYVFQEDVIIHPISFSIPQSFLVPEVPVKTAHLVNDTRNFQVKKYRFGPLQEAEYHEWLREHRFAGLFLVTSIYCILKLRRPVLGFINTDLCRRRLSFHIFLNI